MRGRLTVVGGCVLSLLCGFLGASLHAIWASPPPTDHNPGSFYFEDVAADSPHGEDIGYLRECGVVGGYTDGTYRPAVPVTREQMATYVARGLAFGAVAGELLADYDYFDGWYWGQYALDQGWITADEYAVFADCYAWVNAMVWAELTPMGYEDPYQGALAARNPLTPEVVEQMARVRMRVLAKTRGRGGRGG